MLKLEGLEPHEVAALLPLWPIYVAYRGSISHGMYIPSTDPESIDDVDLIATYIPDGLGAYFGLGSTKPSTGMDRKVRQYDLAAYELRHLMNLLAGGNPNVVSALWVRPEHILLETVEGKVLREAKRAFLSKRLYHSFSGYAYGQLKRMTAFTEEEGCCAGETFHTPECPLREGRGRGSVKKYATGFMGAKRKGLVKKFGFDTKNAAHLIRLLRMGVEVLLTEEVRVWREDAAELLEIKRGEWSLERVRAEAERGFSQMEDALAKTKLPDEPNHLTIENLCIDILSFAKSPGVVMRSQAALQLWNPLPRGKND